MKILMVGGAGISGTGAARDLIRNDLMTELVLADLDPARVEQLISSLDDPRVRGITLDATDTSALAEQLKGFDICANAAIFTLNLGVMKACLEAGTNYLDLGGFFHYSKKQLELDEQFKEKGLTGIIGMGAGPGTTNLMGGWCASQLDTVEKFNFQAGFKPSSKGREKDKIFVPPYSLVTILDELTKPSFQFLDGEFKEAIPGTGREEIDFGDPVGRQTVHYTLHSEPLFISNSYKDSGVKEATFQIGLPPDLTSVMKTFISAGFAMEEKIKIGETDISPAELLNLVIQENIKQNPDKIPKKKAAAIIDRAHVTGIRGDKKVEIVADMITPTGLSSRLDIPGPGTSIGFTTGIEMIYKGMVEKGAGGSEKMIKDYDYYLDRLKGKGFIFRTKENILD